MKKFLLLPTLMLSLLTSGQDAQDTTVMDTAYFRAQTEALAAASKRASEIKFQTGPITLENGIGLNVPPGYKFIPANDAEWIVYDFWGNPRSSGIMGMLVKENYEVMNEGGWAFVLTFDKMGYVEDDDASKIDYDDLLKDMQSGEADENKEREKMGYGAIHMLGWASKPYYDDKNKVLHWAKSLKFSGAEDTTLNYDVRVLGRYGVLSMNAVGTINDLDDIKQNIPAVTKIAHFTSGNAYADFDSKIDAVAAVTIGGLVAGKVLAKAGILALLLKNIKLIFLAVIGAGGFIWKKISGRKKEESFEEPAAETPQTEV
ncbi:MAG: DUF2167 domain-containing protein [Sphingobacteriales bacterium]|nr:MAG: DUF2167 domain-containing protein [Sphingobacteriales bacterium]